MRTETLAVVFTDIKGYTAATSAQTHQQNASMLRKIERLVAPVVRAYNGRVIKTIGDAYMIVFRSPTEAVRCATAIQDRLFQYNTTHAKKKGEQGFHIRIAMNIGEVRVHRGDVFGEPVNIAARIESITPAEEVYFSEAIFLTMNRSDLPIERVGEYELKGIPEPVTVYRVKPFGHASKGPENAAPVVAPSLPFGGGQLGHWRRMQWLRRAYMTMWILAVVGLGGAAYLRYRPADDFGPVVAQVKQAMEADQPMDVLALAGQIPPTATQEREQVRVYRRQAARSLIAAGDVETAGAEVDALLAENERDAEALLIKAKLLQQDGHIPASVDTLEAALKLVESLATRPEVVELAIKGYIDPKSRNDADRVVYTYIKQAAVEPMLRALSDNIGDRLTRNTIAVRLEKLGAGDQVDWVTLAIEDLQSSSCTVRKRAISRLSGEGDERAVGPLMKLGESKGCGASNAKEAANRILGK